MSALEGWKRTCCHRRHRPCHLRQKRTFRGDGDRRVQLRYVVAEGLEIGGRFWRLTTAVAERVAVVIDSNDPRAAGQGPRDQQTARVNPPAQGLLHSAGRGLLRVVPGVHGDAGDVFLGRSLTGGDLRVERVGEDGDRSLELRLIIVRGYDDVPPLVAVRVETIVADHPPPHRVIVWIDSTHRPHPKREPGPEGRCRHFHSSRQRHEPASERARYAPERTGTQQRRERLASLYPCTARATTLGS